MKVYYILENKLKIVSNNPVPGKGVNAVAYNEGGNQLAADFSGKIVIYDAYNVQEITSIKGNAPIINF